MIAETCFSSILPLIFGNHIKVGCMRDAARDNFVYIKNGKLCKISNSNSFPFLKNECFHRLSNLVGGARWRRLKTTFYKCHGIGLESSSSSSQDLRLSRSRRCGTNHQHLQFRLHPLFFAYVQYFYTRTKFTFPFVRFLLLLLILENFPSSS
jgi:hypothetical protein